MLVLTRKIGESIRIGDDINVVLLSRQAGQIKVGIEAPREVRILRGELEEKQRAAQDPS